MCFKRFADEVSAARGSRRTHAGWAARNTAKLIGNALYGKTITNKEKFATVSYCEQANTTQYTNAPLFRHMQKISPTLYQIQMKQPRAVHDLPIQIGFWVYSLSKLRMLEFYYDLLLKFFFQEKFELIQMDIDSLYFAINGENIEDILNPTRRKE